MTENAERNVVSCKEFCRRNGISRAKFYLEVRAGRLIARKIGSRTIVTTKEEAAWLNSLPLLASKTSVADVLERPNPKPAAKADWDKKSRLPE